MNKNIIGVLGMRGYNKKDILNILLKVKNVLEFLNYKEIESKDSCVFLWFTDKMVRRNLKIDFYLDLKYKNIIPGEKIIFTLENWKNASFLMRLLLIQFMSKEYNVYFMNDNKEENCEVFHCGDWVLLKNKIEVKNVKKLLKKNKNLTSKAKELFGDCVMAAFVSVDYFEEYEDEKCFSKKVVLEKLKSASTEEYNSPGEIGLADGVFIKFINEKLLFFSISEWGSVIDTKGDNFFTEIEFIED
jgi:hypothetical protein